MSSPRENVSRSNPDPRPLPDGWVQHYDASKQLWYYVQIAHTPPKIVFMHPADLLNPTPTNQGGRTPNSANGPTNLFATQSPNSYSASAYPSPLSPNQPQGMSVAQRLYASSQSSTAPPMISANDISCLSTSLDVSPQCRSRTFPSPSLPTFPVNGNQDSQRYAVDEAGPALSLYGDRLNHRYRSPTSPPVAFPSSGHTIQRRRHALPPQIPQISYSGNSAVSPPRQTPHLITKAKPPPDSTKATDLLITKFPVQAPSPSPLSPLNLNLSSPPPTSLLFSASAQQNLSPMSPPTISVSPNSGASMAGSTATLPQNAHNVTQQLTEHQQTMDALKNQEAALAAQQAVINQQQALLEMQLLKQQQQQQQVLAQQQAFMHGDQTLNHQQQLQAMQHQIAHQHQQAIPQQPAVHLQTVPMQQTTHVPAQLSMPVQHIQQHQNQNTAPAMTSMASSNSQHQGPTSQLFMPPGSQQQSGPNTNTNSLVSQVGHHVATHLVNSIMGNGSNQGDSTSSTTSPGATDSSAAGGGWNSLAQTLNGVVGGNNQDPSQGLFGGMSQSWVDGIGNVDLGALSTGFDSSSFGGDFTEC